MTKSRKNKRTDVLIIGAGPAGLSAFKWCAELGMSAVLVERGKELGGQLLSIYNPITNYLGRTAANGRELLSHFLSQFDGLESNAVVHGEVTRFDPGSMSATLATGEVLEARAVVIATGVRRRRLGVPGEAEFFGRGILESGAKEKETVQGKRVAIIGGGDAALENALILSELADKVYIVHRRSEFSARKEFVQSAARDKKIEFVLDSIVMGFAGDKQLAEVSVSNAGGSKRHLEIDAALIRIGVQPITDFVDSKVDLDSKGYVLVDRSGLTNLSNVFAVGDVANPLSPTVQTAAGTAAAAIKTVYSALFRRQDQRYAADRATKAPDSGGHRSG